MHTAVATSLAPSQTVASTDAADWPRLALVLAYGAEHVSRICAASHAELIPVGVSMPGMSLKGHSRTCQGRPA